jgi:hypothetical protein
MSALVINTWRCMQACTIICSFLLTNPNPTVTQLRCQLQKMTVEDFKFTFAKDLLKNAAIQRNTFQNAILPLPNQVAGTEEDTRIAHQINALYESGNFPPLRDRPRLFNEPQLKKIRLYQNTTVNHGRVKLLGGTNGTRKIRRMCALCSTTKYQWASSFQCSICKVALYTRPLKGAPANYTTCFVKWHTCEDIRRESTRRTSALGTSRNNKTIG